MRAKLQLYFILCLATALPFAPLASATGKVTAKDAASFVRAAPLPKWAQPLADIPPAKSDDTVVVRLSESQAWVGPNPAELHNLAIQVNGKSALDSIGQFGISYLPAYQKLLLHRVALLRGKEIIDRTSVVNTRLLERETGLENGVYGGATTVQLLLEDVHVGDTLWLTYTVEGVNPVFGKTWSDIYGWDSASPVESRKLTVIHPKNRPLQWRTLGDFNTKEVKPVIDQLGANARLVFSDAGLEALDYEASTPPDYISHRRLQFSEFSDWHEVAVWANGLFPRLPASPAAAALVRKFAQQGDPMAQASAALHWVQDEIRYFSVSMGENSHRPQLPEVVLKHRYGDCKDKSYLLVSLLHDLGIKATPVLVSALAPALPGKLLPTPALFDHVVVQVDIDGVRYNVDPTRSSERGLISTLPPAIPGGSGLLVDPATTALITLSDSPQTEAQLERFEKITINAFDGDATLDVRKIYRRRYAEFARLSLPSMSSAELRKSVLEQYEKQYPGISVLAAPVLKDSDDGSSFELQVRFKLLKPLSHNEGIYRIEFDSKLVNDTLEIPAKLVRNFPFAFPLGRFHGRYHLDVLWPQTVRANIVGSPGMTDTPFFSLKEEASLRGNHFHYDADYAIKRAAIAAAELPELQLQAKAMAEKLMAVAKVSDNQLVNPQGLGLTLRNLEVAHAGVDMRAFGQQYGKSKIEDVPIAEVCDFYIDTYAMGNALPNWQLLANSLDNMLREQSARAGVKSCRAKFLYSTGEFAASVPLFGADAQPDASDPVTAMLAWARFYAGTDPDGAQGAIRQFYDARKRKGVLSGYDVADTVALLQRLGAALPPELEQDAAMPTRAWPYPVVAMQLGQLSIDALLATIDAMADDERELAANDANFYIAQAFIAQGKTQQAIDTLRWYPVHGLRTSRIGRQAVAELWRQTHADPDLNAGVEAETAKDFGKAFQYYTKAAARDVPVAQYNLGMFYYRGEGTGKDIAKAIHWFTLAAGNGVPGAMNYLGNAFNEGEGVAVDNVRSIQWYEAGARFGDFHASSNLGSRYLAGRDGVRQDYAKAYLHLSRGAELGHARAQADLSYLYTEGKGTEKDYALANFWATLALLGDDTSGLLRMGILMRQGYGTPKDPARAVKLFEVCAEKGWHSCVYQLALAYEAGEGVKQDAAKAQALYERAATEGNAAAQLYVAQRSLASDPHSERARDMLIKAAWGGEEKAFDLLADMVDKSLKTKPDLALIEQLAGIRSHANGGAFNYAEAARWYAKAVDLGSNFAMNNLGDMYENGFGVEKDLDKALALYRRAAAKGHGYAFYSLGSVYEKGIGVQASPRLAFVYFQLAMKNGIKQAGASRDKVSKMLPESERQSADALVAAWAPSQPIPME